MPEDLEDVADFFRSRLFAIKANILKNENRLKRVNEAVTRFTNLVNNFGNRNSRSNGRILVTVSSDIPVNAQFKISYVVFNAGWQPAYDLRVNFTEFLGCFREIKDLVHQVFQNQGRKPKGV